MSFLHSTAQTLDCKFCHCPSKRFLPLSVMGIWFKSLSIILPWCTKSFRRLIIGHQWCWKATAPGKAVRQIVVENPNGTEKHKLSKLAGINIWQFWRGGRMPFCERNASTAKENNRGQAWGCPEDLRLSAWWGTNSRSLETPCTSYHYRIEGFKVCHHYAERRCIISRTANASCSSLDVS